MVFLKEEFSGFTVYDGMGLETQLSPDEEKLMEVLLVLA